jgi:small-conductance mechanosensitive channel
MKETADENIKDIEEQAQSELSRLAKKYYISSKSMKPEVYITFDENWVVLSLRYVTDARKRRDIESKLKGLILEKFEKDEDIEIASVSLEITSFPNIKEK